MEFKKIAKDSMIPLKATLRVSGIALAGTGRFLFGTDQKKSQKLISIATTSLVAAGAALTLIDGLRGHAQDASVDADFVLGVITTSLALTVIKILRRESEFNRNKEKFLDSASKVLRGDETVKLAILASANALTPKTAYEVLGEERFLRFTKQLEKDGLIEIKVIGLEAVLPIWDQERHTLH